MPTFVKRSFEFDEIHTISASASGHAHSHASTLANGHAHAHEHPHSHSSAHMHVHMCTSEMIRRCAASSLESHMLSHTIYRTLLGRHIDGARSRSLRPGLRDGTIPALRMGWATLTISRRCYLSGSQIGKQIVPQLVESTLFVAVLGLASNVFASVDAIGCRSVSCL